MGNECPQYRDISPLLLSGRKNLLSEYRDSIFNGTPFSWEKLNLFPSARFLLCNRISRSPPTPYKSVLNTPFHKGPKIADISPQDKPPGTLSQFHDFPAKLRLSPFWGQPHWPTYLLHRPKVSTGSYLMRGQGKHPDFALPAVGISPQAPSALNHANIPPSDRRNLTPLGELSFPHVHDIMKYATTLTFWEMPHWTTWPGTLAGSRNGYSCAITRNPWRT